MSDIARHLITTADERTWKFDRPVVFLGEWCKSYNRKHIWQQIDAQTLCPLGKGQAEKDRLYAEARALENRLFPILVEVLNQHHQLTYTERTWKILIGPWLRRNVDVISNRINTLEKCMQHYTLSGTTAIRSEVSLAPADALTALASYGRDDWNVAVFVRIMELSGAANCPVEWLSDTAATEPPVNIASLSTPLIRKVLKQLAISAGKIARLFCRETDAFIIHTYLPLLEQIKLQIALGQFPQFWVIPKPAFTNRVDSQLRQQLLSSFNGRLETRHARLAATLMMETLPSCYLEEFSTLLETVLQLPFPATPRFIFTSNNFEANEVFQLWAALKAQSGSQYFIGQHGNNYGTYRYMSHTIEEETSDKFLTWGWKGALNQHTPAFIFKMSGLRKPLRQDPKGGLLLVENILGHRIYVWDRPHDFESYLQQQITFAKSLNQDIKKQLKVRLHYTHTSFNACEPQRWRDMDQSITVEPGIAAFKQLVEQSRLVVYGYDSTGILESLALNLPTLVLMENGFEFLHDDALPYYQQLLEAGIVHVCPKAAADKVNEIWGHVDAWWFSGNVQAARANFCDRYSRLSNAPVADLIKILQ